MRRFTRSLLRSKPVCSGGLAMAALCVALGTTGCQTHINGQTLPSAYYLQDDIQFFPAGPEFQLTNQVSALEEYRARRAGVDE